MRQAQCVTDRTLGVAKDLERVEKTDRLIDDSYRASGVQQRRPSCQFSLNLLLLIINGAGAWGVVSRGDYVAVIFRGIRLTPRISVRGQDSG